MSSEEPSEPESGVETTPASGMSPRGRGLFGIAVFGTMLGLQWAVVEESGAYFPSILVLTLGLLGPLTVTAVTNRDYGEPEAPIWWLPVYYASCALGLAAGLVFVYSKGGFDF